jgi:plasmid stabilization system protein ParE
MKPALLRLSPRARRDLEECVSFVGRFPWGKPEERRREIYATFQKICEFPERHPVEIRRRRSGEKCVLRRSRGIAGVTKPAYRTV